MSACTLSHVGSPSANIFYVYQYTQPVWYCQEICGIVGKEMEGMIMNYVLDVHSHTIASGHAYSTMREMARAAKDKGLELLGITEHAMAMPWTCGDYYFENMKMVDRHMEGIDLLLGTEVNILDFDGNVDMKERILRQMDLVIASMHVPCIKSGTMEENTRAYQKVMENPYVDIIGHPEDARFPVDFEALVCAAKDHRVLLEVNNNSLDARCNRENGRENYSIMLEYCKKYQAPVIVNSDSHVDQLVGRHEEAYELLREIDFPEELVVNRSVAELKKYLHKFNGAK